MKTHSSLSSRNLSGFLDTVLIFITSPNFDKTLRNCLTLPQFSFSLAPEEFRFSLDSVRPYLRHLQRT